jgi:DNA-binding MarR family transcriptional regulator
MTSSDHDANVLGALALVLHDRMSEAIAEAAGQPETGAAALSVLLQFMEQPRVGLLHRALGLTPSGAVRMLDKLEAAGWVRRGPGADGRSTSVRLTASGRRVAQRAAAARAAVLDDALGVLSADERRAFTDIVDRLLVGQIRDHGATKWMCRLCDAGACGHAEGRCPVGAEARRRWGATSRA